MKKKGEGGRRLSFSQNFIAKGLYEMKKPTSLLLERYILKNENMIKLFF